MKRLVRFLPGLETLFVTGAIIDAPLALAAFAIYYLGLALFLDCGTMANEVFGFTPIFGMFNPLLGVPLVAVLLRFADLPWAPLNYALVFPSRNNRLTDT